MLVSLQILEGRREMIKEDLRIPDMVVPHVLDIDFEELSRQGRFYYIFDLDNTLARRDESLPQWPISVKIRHAQAAGWIGGIVIISNIAVDRKWLIVGQSRAARVRKSALLLDSGYIACTLPILKPHPRPFLQAMEIMNARSDETVVIGDQISKDIVGGNRVGAFTILVEPLGPDMWLTAILRYFKERKLRARLSAQVR